MAIRNKSALILCLLWVLTGNLLLAQEAEMPAMHYWTIFDSFGASGQWQSYYSGLTGWHYHTGNDEQLHPISYGGTSSSAREELGSLVRAQNLVNHHGDEPVDVIFFENVNDIHSCTANAKPYGSIEDKPWMPKERLKLHALFTSRAEAQQWATDSLMSVLADIEPDMRERCNTIALPYCTGEGSGTRISFLSTATEEGDLTITVSGKAYGVHVTTQMSIQQIVDKVTEWHFGPGWEDCDNGDGSVTFSFWTETQDQVTFDANDTGVTAQLTPDTRSTSLLYFFRGEPDTEWTVQECWTTAISLYSAYKGMFAYLKEALPQSKIFLFLPSYYYLDFSDETLRKADGTLDEEAIGNLQIMKQWQHLKEFWYEVCEACQIQILDIENTCGITTENVAQYYHSNDVHPNDDGYKCWAEALKKLMEQTFSLEGKTPEELNQKIYDIGGYELHEEPESGLYIKARKRVYKMPS